MKIAPWWAVQHDASKHGHTDQWAAIPVLGCDHAIWLLGDVGDNVHALRDLLADGSTNSSRFSDHCIIKLVAQKLADRQLSLLRKVTHHAAAPIPEASAGVPQAFSSPPPPVATGRNATKPTPAPLHASTLAVAAAPAVKPEFASVDQDAQAETLRTAAADGVPFCAVCEQLKHRRNAGSTREAA